MLHLVLGEQRVVDRQNSAAGIAEHMLHTLVAERLDHHFGAGHFACHGRLSFCAACLEANKKGPQRAMSGRFRRAALSGQSRPRPNRDYEGNNIAQHRSPSYFRCAAYSLGRRTGQANFAPAKWHCPANAASDASKIAAYAARSTLYRFSFTHCSMIAATASGPVIAVQPGI